MSEILQKLSGGDLRSEGRAAEVAAQVIDDPGSLSELAAGLSLDDKLIRARTCMSLEVLSRSHPELLEPLAPELIRTAESETVAQARWHLAEIFCNVSLDQKRAERTVSVLLEYLEDKSRIVTYRAVQALGVLGSRSTRRSEIAAEIQRHASDSKSMAKAVARALAEMGHTGSEGG
ncbi:MAG: HEAT repeat domain-containing protein [Planctomycetota bacterium]|jgi:HEAT repeat protein